MISFLARIQNRNLSTIGLLFCCSIFLISVAITAKKAVSLHHQHDFISYYYGTKAAISGLNPYVSSSLSQLSGKSLQPHLHYAYPPFTLVLFKPLTSLSFETARGIFLFVKVIFSIGLFWIWARLLPQRVSTYLLLLLLALAAFHSAISTDILSGNVSIFEQFFLWVGFSFYLKNQPKLAAVFIAISGLIKGPLILFLCLFLIQKKSIDWRSFGLGSLIFLTVHGLSQIFQPDLYAAFLAAPNTLDSSGFVNPSSLAWFSFELGPMLKIAGLPLYLAYLTLFITAAAIFFFKSIRSRSSVVVLSYIILVYGLVMPRLKDYSFILFILPAVLIISWVPQRWIKFLTTVLLCISLWPYHHLFSLLLLISILLFSTRSEWDTSSFKNA